MQLAITSLLAIVIILLNGTGLPSTLGHRDTDHLFSRPLPIHNPRSALYLHIYYIYIIYYIPLSTAVGIRPTMNRVFDCRSVGPGPALG